MLSFTIPPNIKSGYEILISVVTFDIFGYFIEDVNFGQTETEPFNERLDFLKYDSLNILTNMFSIHIFLALLLIKTFFAYIAQFSCIKNFLQHKICKSCRRSPTKSVADSFISGILRLTLVGFFEIVLCLYIGFGIFKLKDQMTKIDALTATANVFYTILVIVYCITLIYFVLIKSRPLLQLK